MGSHRKPKTLYAAIAAVPLVTAAVVISAGAAAPAVALGSTSYSNLIANPSFESSLTGWGSWQGTLKRVHDQRAADGSYAAAVIRTTGSQYSIDNWPGTSAGSPGTLYNVSAYASAASSTSLDKPENLFVRELAANGAVIQVVSSPTVSLAKAWQQLNVQLTVRNAGDTVDVYLMQSNATSGDAFYADEFVMTAQAPPVAATPSTTTTATATPTTTATATPTATATATPTRSASSTPHPPPSPTSYGYAVHILSQTDPDAYVALAANGGANTVRDDFDWNSMEPTTKGVFDWSASDRKMTYAANHGLHMLMILDGTPGWAATVQGQWSSPPVNPADYGDMAGALTARYGATGTFWAANPTLPKVLPAGIELWNEENTSRFWGGLQPDPVKYTAMVKAAYPAVKGHDPSMVVLTGGLAPVGGYNDANCNGGTSGTTSGAENGLNYLQAMYANGAAGNFDAVGWHPYNFWNGATAVQMLAYHPCSAWSQMADTPVSVRSLMTVNGDSAKKIWSTEFGAPSCIAGATYQCVTETEQANLATNSMVLWKGFSWSGGYYWYDVRDDFGGTSTTNDEAHFGAVRGDGSLKPSYSTLKTAWSQ